jgi:hypothetical protein
MLTAGRFCWLATGPTVSPEALEKDYCQKRSKGLESGVYLRADLQPLEPL